MAIDFITPAITSYSDSMSDNELVAARGRQTAKLWLPIVRQLMVETQALKYGIDPYRPKLHGHHPLTGFPVTVVFNEPAPGRKNIINWNPLTQCWFYSEDAGLTWVSFQTEQFNDYVVKADVILNGR